MAVSYNKLWKLLIDKKMKRTELMELSGISTNVLAKLGHDESVSMDSIAKICKVLNCDIGEVMEITSDD
jgi:DNA (cytosine-5)-methyltransferase 1